MPYISGDRKQLEEAKRNPQSPGQLNYAISCLLIDYLDEHRISYVVLNEIVGAVELAKQEFIRRVVNPYEEKKIETSNNDIYQYIEEQII